MQRCIYRLGTENNNIPFIVIAWCHRTSTVNGESCCSVKSGRLDGCNGQVGDLQTPKGNGMTGKCAAAHGVSYRAPMNKLKIGLK